MNSKQTAWTIQNATDCAALYAARAEEFESKTRELVHAPYWLDSFALTAECSRREARYCQSKLESLTA